MYDRSMGIEEYANWRDTGCDMGASCLSCPLPRCIEEEPRGRQRMRLDARAAAMKDMLRQGKSTQEIARSFSVSTRTVQRSLNRLNGNGRRANILNSKLLKPNNKETLNTKH